MEFIVLGKKNDKGSIFSKTVSWFPFKGKKKKKKRDIAVFQTVRAHKIKKSLQI